ncbi:hypothetical protein SS50377_26394 [Spironucleus salmonicida]|uniref:Uncharacterized protein n=1 Tax=Spironucleus salmonicida TaxID=348837 RepID=V6M391_9EUKA|nr:hypothetical protein SS50377_26394 [Spironucleus salmonicida]|eukprot:EST47739.1 Hypothetical protein SS50377_12138 [Spironucleus salmonicida]
MYQECRQGLDKDAIMKFAFNQDKFYINKVKFQKSPFVIQDQMASCNYPQLFFNVINAPKYHKVLFASNNIEDYTLAISSAKEGPKSQLNTTRIKFTQRKLLTPLEIKSNRYKALHKSSYTRHAQCRQLLDDIVIADIKDQVNLLAQ